MKIFIEKENKTKNINFNGKTKDLLNLLKINPETVLVVKNSKLITEEDLVTNKDNLSLLSVISGG